MDETAKRRLAKLMLASAALIWGGGFVVMKTATDVLPVYTLLAIRFLGAAVLLGLVFWKKWRLLTPAYLWRGGVLGTLFIAAYIVQTFGLKSTTPSNNAFLTATYCVIVPFLGWWLNRVRPDRWNILAAFLCVAGVALVSMNGSFSIGVGDSLTLLCALFFAFHIVMVNKLAVGFDVTLLTVLQLAVAGLLSFVCALLFDTAPDPAVLTPSVLWQLVYLTVVATTVTNLFQNVGQVWSDDPSAASILLSLEAVFGVLFSVLFYGDPLTPRLLLGFSVIFLSVLCSETKLSFLRKGTREKEGEPL